jgi:D-erythronate 2-dehydrogenase
LCAPCCAENLVHAATMDVSRADPARAWPLPVLHLSIAQVIETCARLYGDDRRQLVTFEPNEKLEAVFGRYPPLDDSASRALGLYEDGSPGNLVRRAVAQLSAVNPNDLTIGPHLA